MKTEGYEKFSSFVVLGFSNEPNELYVGIRYSKGFMDVYTYNIETEVLGDKVFGVEGTSVDGLAIDAYTRKAISTLLGQAFFKIRAFEGLGHQLGPGAFRTFREICRQGQDVSGHVSPILFLVLLGGGGFLPKFGGNLGVWASSKPIAVIYAWLQICTE